MPDGFHVLPGGQHGAEVEADLAQELVGPEPVVVPDGDLQDPGSEVGRTNARINETLVPLRVAGVHQGFRAPFGKLSGFSFFRFLFFVCVSMMMKKKRDIERKY